MVQLDNLKALKFAAAVAFCGVASARFSGAQSSSTDCRSQGIGVHCDTRSTTRKVLGPNCELVDRSNAVSGSRAGLIAAIGQVWVDSDNRKACAAKIAAESAAVVQRITAQWDLFLPRARMVMQNGADSLGLRDSTRARYWSEAATTMQRLWIVDQQASTGRMREALEPVTSDYAARWRLFSQRCVEIFGRVADSLSIPAAERDPLTVALNARLIPLAGNDLDASSQDIYRVMAPVFDSARTARRKP